MFRKKKSKENMTNKTILVPIVSEYWEPMENLGFTFLGKVEDRFVHVQIPSDWKLKTVLVNEIHTYYPVTSYEFYDERGRKRGSSIIVSNDRSDIKFYCRLYTYISFFYSDGLVLYYLKVCLLENQKEIWKGTPRLSKEDLDKGEMLTWLAENYPDYENPFAYWDEDISE